MNVGKIDFTPWRLGIPEYEGFFAESAIGSLEIPIFGVNYQKFKRVPIVGSNESPEDLFPSLYFYDGAVVYDYTKQAIVSSSNGNGINLMLVTICGHDPHGLRMSGIDKIIEFHDYRAQQSYLLVQSNDKGYISASDSSYAGDVEIFSWKRGYEVITKMEHQRRHEEFLRKLCANSRGY